MRIDLTPLYALGGVILCATAALAVAMALIRMIWSRRGRTDGTASDGRADERLPYERVPALLTDAERTFYDVLRRAIPQDLTVFPQVRLANLVRVAGRERNSYVHFNRIAAKCVDFVVCDALTTAPRLVVELDDSSHQRADRRRRDEFVDAALESAGLPILHVAWQAQYEPLWLAEQLNAALARASAPNAWAPPAALYPYPAQAGRVTRVPVSGATHASETPRLAPRAAPVVVTRARELQWACGACQQQVSRDVERCPHCGTNLA